MRLAPTPPQQPPSSRRGYRQYRAEAMLASSVAGAPRPGAVILNSSDRRDAIGDLAGTVPVAPQRQSGAASPIRERERDRLQRSKRRIPDCSKQQRPSDQKRLPLRVEPSPSGKPTRQPRTLNPCRRQTIRLGPNPLRTLLIRQLPARTGPAPAQHARDREENQQKVQTLPPHSAVEHTRQASVRLVWSVCLGPSPAWLSSCRV
jgi:hypothetical protein